MQKLFETKLYKFLEANILYILFIIALLATLISLALSEVFKLLPCSLCWYQRTMMYALPFIFAVGIMRKDQEVDAYAWPLALVGWVVAGFHTLLQWGIISEAIAPCNAAANCSIKQINWFGFVTIPFMSFVAFSAIIVGLLMYKKSKEKGSKHGTRN